MEVKLGYNITSKILEYVSMEQAYNLKADIVTLLNNKKFNKKWYINVIDNEEFLIEYIKKAYNLQKIFIDSTLLEFVIKKGYINVLPIIDNLNLDLSYSNAMDWAAKHGRLDVVKWLHDKYGVEIPQ